MNNINITNPYLLFIAIPLVALVLVGYFLMPKQSRGRTKNIISVILHLVMCFTLALSFADIQFLTTTTQTELLIVADCSISEKNASGDMDKIIQEVYKKADSGTKIGVVGFAGDAKVITPLGGSFTTVADMFDANKTPDFNLAATDLENALNFAEDLYSENSVKRMLIVSDGIETDGNAIDALDSLIEKEVSIDAISLHEEEKDEFEISSIEYTDHVFLNKENTIKVLIKSKEYTTIDIDVTRDGEPLDIGNDAHDFDIIRGLNVFEFNIDYTVDDCEDPYFDYQVTISGATTDVIDNYPQNNTRSFRQDVTENYKVLFVTDSKDHLNDLKNLNIYDENTEITACYQSQARIPYKLEDLMKYDEFVLSDVNPITLNHKEKFIANLNTAVKTYGKSLLTFGNTFSSGTSTDYMVTYNDMLPVQFESDEAKALVILIDNSGSMESDNRITKAKQGAIAVLDALGEDDYVSIITFSDTAKIVQPLTSARNKESITKAINTIQSDGGTEMGKGLEASYNQLKNSTVEYKYVLTLSDGDPFDSQSSLENYIANTMVGQGNISCSFINISNMSGSSLLKALAAKGNGSYYYCNTASELKNTMIDSVSNDISTTAIYDTDYDLKVTVRTPDDPVMNDVRELQDIQGYNYCRVKPAATTVLTVPYNKKKDSTDDDNQSITIQSTVNVPLYAYWNFGKGKVTSFTSSIASSGSCSNWSKNFRSDKYGTQFFKNLATQALPDRHTSSRDSFEEESDDTSYLLDMEYVPHGKTTTVNILAALDDNKAKVTIEVTDPNDEETKDYNAYYSGGYYTAEVDTPIVGRYNVAVSYKHAEDYDPNAEDTEEEEEQEEEEEEDIPFDDSDAEIKGNLSLYYDYSPEYDFFAEAEGNVLYRLTKTSGQVLTDIADYTSLTEELQYRSYTSTMMFFLLTTVILFLADVFVRKSTFSKKFKNTAAASFKQKQLVTSSSTTAEQPKSGGKE